MITVNASSPPMRHSAVALSPWALDSDTVSFQGSQRAKSSPSPSHSLHTGGLSTDTVMTNHCCFQRSVLGYSSWGIPPDDAEKNRALSDSVNFLTRSQLSRTFLTQHRSSSTTTTTSERWLRMDKGGRTRMALRWWDEERQYPNEPEISILRFNGRSPRLK